MEIRRFGIVQRTRALQLIVQYFLDLGPIYQDTPILQEAWRVAMGAARAAASL